jgi:hypothetical protein
LHEKLIKQIKSQQEIIANLPKLKDSCLLEDTNPEAVAEQEARQSDAIAASDNEDQILRLWIIEICQLSIKHRLNWKQDTRRRRI